MDEQQAYEQTGDTAENTKPKRSNVLQALIPRNGYFITPILVNLNILVFVAMLVTGVSAWSPTVEQLLKWGANYRPLTLGQPWRLFTCMFIHAGFLHIFVNMFSLINLGRLLESFIGKWRFLLLYILTGLCGSIASTWWHEVPAVGASGAILGVFGIFVAIVTTNLIEPSVRKKMFRSVIINILLLAVLGLWAGVDNAAHLGGLLSGMIGGYLIYFDLKSFYFRRKKQVTGIAAAVIILGGLIFLFWKITPAPIEEGKSDVDVYFARYDAERLAAYDFAAKLDSGITLEQVHNNYTKRWDHCLALIDTISGADISSEGEKYVEKLKKSTLWGKQSAIYYERALKEHRKDFIDSGNVMLNKHNSTFEDLTKEMEGDN